MQTTENHTQSRNPLREVIAFMAITYTLVLAIAIAFPHAHINQLLSSFSPVVTVVILTFTMFRRGTRRELWRGLGLGKTGLRSWGWAVGVPLLLCGGAFGTALLVGAGHLRPTHLTGSAASNVGIDAVIEFLFMMVFIVCEEIGFRGFVLPRMQQLTTKRRSALVTGFIHGLYHLPLLLIATTYDTEAPRWIAAPMAVLVITGAGVFFAWLRDRSGSLWTVAIGHSIANMTFDGGFAVVASTTSVSLGLVAGETGVATLGVVVIMAVILLMRAKIWQTPVTSALTMQRASETVAAS